MSKTTRLGFGRGQRVELAFRPHRVWWVQALLIAWRWAFELAVVVGLLVILDHLSESMRPWMAALVMASPVLLGLSIPVPRRQLIGWFWCTVTRHRLRTLFVAVRMTNGHGKLPWILLVRPTPVGERALCFMVAGLSVVDLENRTEAIAATCWARGARVSRSPKWAALVWVDVIRRDPLAAAKPLPSELVPSTARVRSVRTDTTATHRPAASEPAPVPVELVEPFPAVPAQRSAVDTTQPVKPARTAKAIPPAAPAPDATAPTVVRNGEDLSDYV